MKRYNLPRLIFINKLDRGGSDPISINEIIRNKLNINSTLVQLPIGSETEFKGIIDIIEYKKY